MLKIDNQKSVSDAASELNPYLGIYKRNVYYKQKIHINMKNKDLGFTQRQNLEIPSFYQTMKNFVLNEEEFWMLCTKVQGAKGWVS